MDDTAITEQLGIQNLPDEVQQQTLEGVHMEVELRTLERLSDVISDEQRVAFTEKRQSDAKAAWRWLTKQVPEAQTTYDTELKAYLAEKTTSTD